MTAPEPSAQPGAASTGTIVHRKAQAGRAEHQSRAMSLAKALRLTLAKVADELFDMSLAVIAVRSETCVGEDLTDRITDAGLKTLLEGPSRRRAAAVLDVALVTGLIQQQTMGKVLPGDIPAERRMTPTDAAITAPFLDALLARAAPLPDDPQDQALVAGYHFGAWIEDRRVLCMALEAQSYEIVTVSLDIAGGVQQGNLILCLPHSTVETGKDKADPSDADSEGGGHPPASSTTLSETVLNLRAELRIALAQVRLPLRALSQWQIGSVIDLGTADFDKVRVQSITGAAVGRGVLGQLDGMRAVQVVDALNAAKRPQSMTAEERGFPQAGAEPRAMDRNGSLSDLPTIPELSNGATKEAETAGQIASAQPDLTDLPDLSDLPDLPDVPEMPDLPDMSDLPDFDDMPALSAMKTG